MVIIVHKTLCNVQIKELLHDNKFRQLEKLREMAAWKANLIVFKYISDKV